MDIKGDFLVQKRNVLNEIRANNMTIQELRFFSIYLAKINKNDISTRTVCFPLSDFQKIMEFDLSQIKSKFRPNYIKSITNGLLSKVVNIADGDGGYTGFQLFKRCRVFKNPKNELGEWFVEIDAHDDALPLMFDFKEKYFSYQLWNALKLRSTNQIRMYEILKQYEKVGERIISVDDLRELLGIAKQEYPRFGDFKTYVLEACRKALAENTDIKFTYEPYGARGRGRKIFKLKFTISKNTDYVDQLSLEEFLYGSKPLANDSISNPHDELITLLQDACNNEFSKDETELLFTLVLRIVPETGIPQADYLSYKYHELRYQAGKRKINNRFAYLKKLIENEAKRT